MVDLQLKTPTVKLGESQNPRLWDYADSVDTMEFLIGLN
jgi:hypothetical protein